MDAAACASLGEAPDLDGAPAVSEEEPGGRYVALGKRLVAWTGYAKSDVQVHRPGGLTSQLLRTSGLRVPLLVKGDASGLIPTLGICLPEDFDIEQRATDTLEDDDRTVLTWDVDRQEYGPAWSVAQWALYWRVRKGFAGKPAAADAAVGPPPGAGTGYSDDSDEGEEVDSKFVKRGGLEQYRKRAEGRRVGIADAQFTRLLEAHWLDLARGPLAGHLHPPLAVAEADLVRLAWRHQAGARRREGGVGVSEMVHLEMSPRGCYTDFALAPGGAALHTHVLRGRRAFALLPPTPHNRSLFLTWMRQARGPGCFLAEYAECAQKVEVGEGQMLVIPHGWMYAAASLADCISVAGLFWHPYALGEIIKAQQLEAAVAASFPAAAAPRRRMRSLRLRARCCGTPRTTTRASCAAPRGCPCRARRRSRGRADRSSGTCRRAARQSGGRRGSRLPARAACAAAGTLAGTGRRRRRRRPRARRRRRLPLRRSRLLL